MNAPDCTWEGARGPPAAARDEAFADMAFIAHHHPDWFSCGEHHAHGHHESGVIAEDDPDHDDLDDDLHAHDVDDMEGSTCGTD